jgi:hypothetical protein
VIESNKIKIRFNTNLTNYGPSTYFWTFFEPIRISVVSTIRRYPLKKKKRLVDSDGPLRKCPYQAFIIQNLDVMTLELDMKVQFANF